MTSDNYYFFFALFVASGLFLWLLGTASFDRRPRSRLNLPLRRG